MTDNQQGVVLAGVCFLPLVAYLAMPLRKDGKKVMTQKEMVVASLLLGVGNRPPKN